LWCHPQRQKVPSRSTWRDNNRWCALATSVRLERRHDQARRAVQTGINGSWEVVSFTRDGRLVATLPDEADRSLSPTFAGATMTARF
jgi:hypothetical protein